MRRLREYEEEQKRVRDDENERMQELEFNQEKERRELQIQSAVDELRSSYNKRLETFKNNLESKFLAQKTVNLSITCNKNNRL